MRCYFFFACFVCSFNGLKAQTAASIAGELQAINDSVSQLPFNGKSAAAITHRGMNVFLADKTGYLYGSNDLSFFTNYITLSTADGRFTVNHNFQPRHGKDDPIRSLFSVGFDLTVPGNYANAFLDRRYESELGLSLRYKWLGKVTTRFAEGPAGARQKEYMDAARTQLLAMLYQQLQEDANNYAAASSTGSATVTTDSIRQLLRQQFYAELGETYAGRFAEGQASLLTNAAAFRVLHTSWTAIAVYLPFYFPSYTVGQSFSNPLQRRRPFPVTITVTHTRFWEMSKAGRIFFVLEGGVLFNNSKLAQGLQQYSYTEYKNSGGMDSLAIVNQPNDRLYIGQYKTFVTPSLTARFLYYPASSHVGISLLAQKNFLDFDPLNLRLGIPVVLINSKKRPAVTLECFVSFYDVTNRTQRGARNSAGLSLGIPFSRLMY
ncbi:MAG TPA: hypothetical protein VL307_13760 [Chitinophagaceae bacterium]|nr:hypothetical protein [Chitinophagaceae bacterium]